jgi:uncharacterized cupin superfamily protein
MRGPDVVMYPEAGVLGAVEQLSSPERGGMATWLRTNDPLEHHEAEHPDPHSSPASTPDRASILEPDFDSGQDRPGFTYRRARIGWQAGTERLGTSLYDLPPGQATFPYHWHSANEELLIVLSGRPSLRTPEGWRELEPGEAVAFPVGQSGAHQIANRADEPARLLMISEMNAPEMSFYPDTGKVGALDRPPGSPDDPDEHVYFFQPSDELDYWEGESPPGAGDGEG